MGYLRKIRPAFWVFGILIGSVSFLFLRYENKWIEEVPLNTGETLFVTRTSSWAISGDAGNPFALGFRPRLGTNRLEFEYRRKKYIYEGSAGVQLLAISSEGVPTLVAAADSGMWVWGSDGKRRLPECLVPYYVQLVPDPTGNNWNWPPAIATWLYDLESNLLSSSPPFTLTKQAVPKEVRKSTDRSLYSRLPAAERIDPTYMGQDCTQRQKSNERK
jgi:hypothetical protein